jgi:hypothetical protein
MNDAPPLWDANEYAANIQRGRVDANNNITALMRSHQERDAGYFFWWINILRIPTGGAVQVNTLVNLIMNQSVDGDWKAMPIPGDWNYIATSYFTTVPQGITYQGNYDGGIIRWEKNMRVSDADDVNRRSLKIFVEFMLVYMAVHKVVQISTHSFVSFHEADLKAVTAILSNYDEDLYERTATQMGVDWSNQDQSLTEPLPEHPDHTRMKRVHAASDAQSQKRQKRDREDHERDFPGHAAAKLLGQDAVREWSRKKRRGGGGRTRSRKGGRTRSRKGGRRGDRKGGRSRKGKRIIKRCRRRSKKGKR